MKSDTLAILVIGFITFLVACMAFKSADSEARVKELENQLEQAK